MVVRFQFLCALALVSALWLVACGGDNSADVAKSFVETVVVKYDVAGALQLVDSTGKTSLDRAAAEKKLNEIMPKLKAFDVRDVRVEPVETKEPTGAEKAKGVTAIRTFQALYSVRSGDTGGAFVPVQAVVTVAQVDGRWVVSGFDIPTEAKRG